MTKVISFVSGPGAGKSTIAHDVFSSLKRQGVKVGWVNEFPTDLVWEENIKGLNDQLWILGEQNHRMYNQLGKVDYIVMDTCLLLGLYYMDKAFTKYKEGITTAPFEDFYWAVVATINATFNMYENIVFYVDRGSRILTEARYGIGKKTDHNEHVRIDTAVRNLLENYRVPYITIETAGDVMEYLNNDKLAVC